MEEASIRDNAENGGGGRVRKVKGVGREAAEARPIKKKKGLTFRLRSTRDTRASFRRWTLSWADCWTYSPAQRKRGSNGQRAQIGTGGKEANLLNSGRMRA